MSQSKGPQGDRLISTSTPMRAKEAVSMIRTQAAREANENPKSTAEPLSSMPSEHELPGAAPLLGDEMGEATTYLMLLVMRL